MTPCTCADALCPQLVALDTLQRQFTFRLPDGAPLSLMQLEREHGQGNGVAVVQ